MNAILGLNQETINYYKACFDNNGVEKDLPSLKWQFFENKAENFVDIEFDANAKKVAAIYATFGVNFKIGDKVYLGSQSLDTMTDIDYRGKGLFIKLAKDVYQKAKENEVALVYGFPNGNSIHGFITKLEWKNLDPLPFLIKPLKTKYFTERIKFLRFLPNINLSFSTFKNNKKYSVKEENHFPDNVTALWNKFSKQIQVAVNRDKTYLDWRYIHKPGGDYTIANCYDIQNNYVGFVIFTVKEKHNGKIGYLMELMYDLDNPKAGKLLLNYAVSKIKSQKADCILSWNLEHSPNNGVFKKAFFINMPEKFRPIELHFGVRAFKDHLATIINNRNNWYISYSDSDTV